MNVNYVCCVFSPVLCLPFDSFKIIKMCWKKSPDDRPSFEDLASMLDVRLQVVAGYMELAMVLEEDEDGMF